MKKEFSYRGVDFLMVVSLFARVEKRLNGKVEHLVNVQGDNGAYNNDFTIDANDVPGGYAFIETALVRYVEFDGTSDKGAAHAAFVQLGFH